MKQGTFGTLQQLAAELDRQNNAKHDFIADTAHMKMITEDKISRLEVIDRAATMNRLDSYQVNSHAMNQVGVWAGIPSGYMERLRSHPGLLDENVNHWLHVNHQPRMLRTMDGQARAFLSNSYKRIDNYPVMELTLKALQGKDITVQSCDVTENRMYLKVVSPKLETEIKKGDVVQFGFVLKNSEIGLGAFELQQFMYTLACLNGMIIPKDMSEGIRRTHLGARQGAGILYRDDTILAGNRAFVLQVRDTIEAMMSEEAVKQTVQRLQDLTTRQITGDVVKGIEVLGKTLGFSQDEGSGILRHLINGGDLSQYGVLNAVTRYAQDAPTYDRASELELMGGKIIDLHPRQWQQVAEAA